MRLQLGLRAGALVASVVALNHSIGAMAQDTAPSEASAASAAAPSDAGDIIVTARRREESLQSVPVAIAAFTSESLRARGIRDTIDLTYSTPGVVFTSVGTSVNPVFTIRGQSRASNGAGLPSVITYLNEVPLSNVAGVLPTYDLSSVQVLKGPQGTLFGRNTTGGAVLAYTQKPTHELGGYGEFTYGNYDLIEGEGALNLPISDAISLRLATQITRRDGWTKNVGVGDDYGDRHRNAFRASVLLEPFDGFSNLTVFDYLDGDEAGMAHINVAVLPTGPQRLPVLAPFFDCGTSPACDIDLVPNLGPRKTNVNLAPRTTFKVWGISNTTTLDLGPVQIKNIFGFRSSKFNYTQDTDGLPLKLVDLYFLQNVSQYSDEIQFSGNALDDRLDWMVGGFYLRDKPGGREGQAVDAFRPDVFPISITNDIASFFSNRSKAVFGQASFEILSGLKINAGLRQTWDQQSGCSLTSPLELPYVNEPTLAQCKTADQFQASLKSNALTYTFGADYQATRDVFLYVTTRKGYRGAGFNTPKFGAALADLQSFRPEVLTDVEVGAKTRWRLGGWSGHVNIAAYRAKYKDIQQIVPVPLDIDGDGNTANDPQNGFLVTNRADATTKGFELEAAVSPNRAVTLTVSTAYIDANFTRQKLPPVLAGVAAALQPFNYTPEWTFSAAIDAELYERSGFGTINAHADYYWSDNIQYDALIAPSYDLVNARIDWNGIMGSKLDLGVFVKNLFDKNYIVANGTANPNLGYFSAMYGDPRMYGATLRYNF